MKKIFITGFLSIAVLFAITGVVVAQSSSPSPTIINFKNIVSSGSVNMNSARLTAEIRSGTGITERGFQYLVNSTSFLPSSPSIKTNGNFSPGVYNQDLTGLVPNTKYFFRAYAKNSSGTRYSTYGSFTTTLPASALTGWAWSSNIGWVSFNCANVIGTCDDSDYKVEMNPTTGLLTGYAWSSNIGWIKFGGLSDYPSAGTAAVPAKINMANGKGEGWARACAGTVGGDCSSMESRTDGWDGWIELAGTNHSANPIITPTPSPAGYSGVRMNTTTGSITGMAWGSNVVGWLNFNANANITTNFIASCVASNVTNNTITFTADATGGSGQYDYKWDNSANFVGTNTYDKTYTPGTTGSIGVSLIVKKRSTGQTVSVSCVGDPLPPGGPVVLTKPECSIESPAANSSDIVSIYEGESVKFKVGDPEPQPGGNFQFVYYPTSAPVSIRPDKTYTHTYSAPMSPMMTRVEVKDVNDIYKPSKFYNCGQVEVKGRGLDLKIAPEGSSIFGKEVTIKKGRNVTLKWMNSLDTNIASANRYRCLAIPPDGTEWNDFANAVVDRDGEVSGLSTQLTGKHEFIISCRKLLTPAVNPKTTSATLNVVSTTGSEI